MDQADSEPKMRNHHFTPMKTIMVLWNMGKEKGKMKKKNTSDRNNMATHHMGIVN